MPVDGGAHLVSPYYAVPFKQQSIKRFKFMFCTRQLTLIKLLIADDWKVLLLMSRGSDRELLSGPFARLDMRGRCLSGVRDMRPAKLLPPFEGVFETRPNRLCPISHDCRGCLAPPELALEPPPPIRTRSGCSVSRERSRERCEAYKKKVIKVITRLKVVDLEIHVITEKHCKKTTYF